MSERRIRPVPLTAERFAPYGDVIEASRSATTGMNEARFERFDDLCHLDAGDGRLAVSVVCARVPSALPYRVDFVERHPLGSQAFMPLSPAPFLVVVCPDEGGKPGEPRAFVTRSGQGVNYARGTWHGVLTPIGEPQDFVVIDRGGDGNNLEEFHFPAPYEITVPSLT